MVYVNAAGLNLVGLASVEECRAKVAFDFCPEVDQIRLKTEMLPTLFRTGTWTGELALRQFVTGLPIPVEMNAFIIKDPQNGQPIALANISRDLTEKNRIEEEKQKLQAQLIHAQKMESIGQLAGGIAHDFNNVLATIFGYCHILQMKMPNDDPLLVHVNQLLTSAERAARLTQSLLAFSRKQIINPEDIDLNEVVNKAEKFLTRVIPEDILLKTTLDAGALMVHADAMQIDQILLNLATNARDAMPKGGRLLLETAQTILDDEYVSKMGSGKPGPYAVLTVSDTGQGMDGQTQNRIFEPFFTTKELGKGTGLGLAIVYGIVKQNNGIINVGSEPGRGTTFKIYLPIVKPSAVIERYPEVEQPLQGGTEAILFAEDNETLRRLNTDLMEEFGYTVIEAADGEEALRLFMEHLDKIDLVILDVIMPKKNGREVFEEARQRAPSLKAIFTSGYPADLIQKEGVLETGINFLPKPSSPEALLQKIRKVLDQ